MSEQQKKRDQFAALHQPGNPIILFNVWDAGSAKALQKAGARAIATGSYSVAGAHGYEDDENFPLELVIANAARIVASVDVPVSIDFVAGYGKTTAEAETSLTALLDTGIIGVNIEDGLPDGSGLVPVKAQAERLNALSAIRSKHGVKAWINARTDVFLNAPKEMHLDGLAEVLERVAAYAEAGADSFFIPGTLDLDLIASVCEASQLPVNVMTNGKIAPSDFASAGVARVSFGGGPWRAAMKELGKAAAEALTQ